MSIIIKFRVWDKDRKVMANVSNIDFLTGQVQMNAGGMHSERVYGDKVILLQYTGLKDKNGVEIYEGDIVSMIIFEDNTEYLGDVVFKNGCFCLNISLNGTKYKIPAFEWKETETIITVIGNIHENPTLLEVSP